MPSKLTTAHERAARVASLSGGSLLIGLSGKDSFVSLAIAAEHFKRIVCFHKYTVRGMRCLEVPLEIITKRFGAELIFVPSTFLAHAIKNAILRPHNIKQRLSPVYKNADAERLARKRSGVDWICYGERLSDSFARRLFWRKLDGVYEKGQRCTFIPDWLDVDVYGYMKAMKLPLPCRFGVGTKSAGFSLIPSTLKWIEQRHPQDFAQVLKVFPFAGIQTMEQPNGKE